MSEIPSPPAAERAAAAPLQVSAPIAWVADGQLFVLGLIGNLTAPLAAAHIYFGKFMIDMGVVAVWLSVGVDKKTAVPEGAGTYFLLLVELPDFASTEEFIRVVLTETSGAISETRLPVHGKSATDSLRTSLQSELLRLWPSIPTGFRERLAEFARKSFRLPLPANEATALPQQVRFGVEICSIIDADLFLVYGSILDPGDEIAELAVQVGPAAFNLIADSVWNTCFWTNPDPALFGKAEKVKGKTFLLMTSLGEHTAAVEQATFSLVAGSERTYWCYPLTRDRSKARAELTKFLHDSDPQVALWVNRELARLHPVLNYGESLLRLLNLQRPSIVDRLPPSLQSLKPRYALYLDRVLRISGDGIFLSGWFDADPKTRPSVHLYNGSDSVCISDNWICHPRPDVRTYLASGGVHSDHDEHGFACYVPLKGDEEVSYISVVSPSGDSHCARLPNPSVYEPGLAALRNLLGAFQSAQPKFAALMADHIGPAVRSIWNKRPEPAFRSVVESFGPRPTQPPVSIIVPIYGRFDFAEYQMALFASDPDFQWAELIYSVDDPAIVDAFRATGRDLYAMYEVAFTIAASGVNLGFAGANNFAAKLARGQRLLLMNSDVMPRGIGWLRRLAKSYDALESPGMLGVKLLYEDGAIQHVGMSFRRLPAWGNLWINDHPHKGQTIFRQSGMREMVAVTAACMMTSAGLYRELGGFSEDYIIGDFEDSDLCLRAISAGRRNYVLFDVELYHLERQSQNRHGDANLRTNVTAYNCWLYNQRWEGLLSALSGTLTSQFDGAGMRAL